MDKKSQKQEEVPTFHWADKAADELITKHAKDTFVCASGISPSGVVHIGNFREVITVDFVVRALKKRGKKVRFIYSWDDYDALRKVPPGLPSEDQLNSHLRRSISSVPDPFGDCDSYAKHFETVFEKEIASLGITPHFIYQNEAYRKGTYHKGILKALENEKVIIAILNRFRTEPLDKWSCISIYCKKCDRDTTELISFEAPSTFRYRCKHCKQDLSTSLDEGRIKLLWRVDWPMRWAHEGVDFEPGGKDHSSQGGSYETGAEIIRAVWKKEPPHYVQYDFVLAKGLGAKLSSSKGQLITLSQALEVYEPSILRWIFASRKPNIDFSIAFDLDVMKAYDDFDRCERYAYGKEPGDEKKVEYEKRIYELSLVNERNLISGELPHQFAFRHLCSLLQIHGGDIQETKKHYSSGNTDEARFVSRATRAWKWITTYAPEEFRFKLRGEEGISKSEYPHAIQEIISVLKSEQSLTEELLATQIYETAKKTQIEPKLLFQDFYQVLIGKNQGPKLSSFLLAIGRQKAAKLLEKSIIAGATLSPSGD